MDRFAEAYRAELGAFLDVAMGRPGFALPTRGGARSRVDREAATLSCTNTDRSEWTRYDHESHCRSTDFVGLCEVPGWGFQLGPQQVLSEMREVG